MVSLATSYHAGRFIQPANPRRHNSFPQDGTICYRPDPARRSDAVIEPLIADIVTRGGGILAEMTRQRDTGGLVVFARTVCLHDSRVGMLHPEHATRTAHDDPNFQALYPCSPAVHDYVLRRVSEIAETCAPNRSKIESHDFLGFSHGYHHEKDCLPLLPEDILLLGLCFCSHCIAAARWAGIAADHVCRSVADFARPNLSAGIASIAVAEFARTGAKSVTAMPDLPAFIHWRSQPVTRRIAELRRMVPRPTRLLLIVAEGSGGGINLLDLVAHLDGIIHFA